MTQTLPLPPRPQTPLEKDLLPEKTLREQEGGMSNIGRFKTKLEAEQEGGRQLVEMHARRIAAEKAKTSL